MQTVLCKLSSRICALDRFLYNKKPANAGYIYLFFNAEDLKDKNLKNDKLYIDVMFGEMTF